VISSINQSVVNNGVVVHQQVTSQRHRKYIQSLALTLASKLKSLALAFQVNSLLTSLKVGRLMMKKRLLG